MPLVFGVRDDTGAISKIDRHAAWWTSKRPGYGWYAELIVRDCATREVRESVRFGPYLSRAIARTVANENEKSGLEIVGNSECDCVVVAD